MAAALGHRHCRVERHPGPVCGPQFDDRTVDRHNAGHNWDGTWFGRRRLVLGDRRESTGLMAVAGSRRSVQRWR